MKYLSINKSDVYRISKSTEKICCLCAGQYQQIHNIITKHDAKYNVCELCKLVILYDKKEMYKIILLMSEIPQKTIINETIKYFNANGCMPSPTNIDIHVKGINMSSHHLRYLMSCNEKTYKNLQKEGVKMFITPELNLDKIVIRNIFSKKSTINNTFWDDVRDLEIKHITEIKLVLNKASKCIKQLDKSRKNLRSKVENLVGLFNMMS
jgi:hypothetical protein